jgi:hypothetical protein
MCLKGLPMKHGGFDDGDSMLQTLMRRIQDLRKGDAQERAVHILNLRHMRDDRDLAECLRQWLRQTVKPSNHPPQDKVLAIE